MINPPLYPPSPSTFFFRGGTKGRGVEGGSRDASIFPALPPTTLPKVHVRSWRGMNVMGKAMGGRAGTRQIKKKNLILATPISAPVPTRTTNLGVVRVGAGAWGLGRPYPNTPSLPPRRGPGCEPLVLQPKPLPAHPPLIPHHPAPDFRIL